MPRRRKTELAAREAAARETAEQAHLAWWRDVQNRGVLATLPTDAHLEQVAEAPGGAWVSKRLLYVACLAHLPAGSTMRYVLFSKLLKKAAPHLTRTRHRDVRTYSRSGILIGRRGELFVWFPGAKRPDFYGGLAASANLW